MKTAKEWVDENSQSGPFDIVPSCKDAEALVLEIQTDACNSLALVVIEFLEGLKVSHERIFEIIHSKPDHPTPEQIFMDARKI